MGQNGTFRDIHQPQTPPPESDEIIDNPYQLTDLQLLSIQLTLQGLSDTHIAKELSINRKTLWRWKSCDDDYRAALADARQNSHATATDRYQVLLFKATSVLAQFLDDPSANHRFRAAQIFLSMAGCYRPSRSTVPIPPKHVPLEPPNIPQEWA